MKSFLKSPKIPPNLNKIQKNKNKNIPEKNPPKKLACSLDIQALNLLVNFCPQCGHQHQHHRRHWQQQSHPEGWLVIILSIGTILIFQQVNRRNHLSRNDEEIQWTQNTVVPAFMEMFNLSWINWNLFYNKLKFTEINTSYSPHFLIKI